MCASLFKPVIGRGVTLVLALWASSTATAAASRKADRRFTGKRATRCLEVPDGWSGRQGL